mmetsp:Transcript_24051/g.72159  ORF Transcript_24051/g.72159 Transcript_24051/m.72159 type:complete len:896 (-) Transcript_24051:96-2783(-)
MAETSPTRLRRAADAVEHGIANYTERVATTASRRPWATIVVSLVCAAALATGLGELKNEDRADKLYVPAGSKAQKDKVWVEDRFGDQDDISTALLDARDGRNLLEKDALMEVFDVYDAVLAIESEGGTRGYDERSCARAYWDPAGPCIKSSILAFWDYDRAALEADDDILATINNADAPDCCAAAGRTVTLERVAARLERDESGRVVAARSLKLDFHLSSRKHSKTNEDPHNRRLEGEFDRTLRRRRSFVYVDRPMPLTGWGESENVGGAFDQDQAFVNGASIVILCYAFWALYDRKDPYLSRGWLGVCAAVVVLVAVAAAFGLALYFGVVFSATASIAVFLILGIGLDDAFVICGAEANNRGSFARDAKRVLDGEDDKEVAAERVTRAMAKAGPSIFVTSVTDFCAFFAGSFTTIPAIEAFCAFCATAVLTDYILQTTLFVAVMTLDMRRKLRRGARELAQDEGGCCRRCATKDALGDPDAEISKPETFFGGRYARALLSKPGMAFVLIGTLGLAVMGAVGAAEVTAEFKYQWFLVDGYYKTNEAYFTKHYRGAAVYPVAVYTAAADYFAEGATMRDLIDEYADEAYVLDTSLEDNWFDAHAAWASADPPRTSREYLESLDAFLASPDGVAYEPYVVRGDGLDVRATRVDALWSFNGNSPSTVLIIRRMVKSRQLGRDVARSLGTRVYAPAFVFGEGVRIVLRESVVSMSIACATVGAVLVLLLGDVVAAGLVGLMVCLVCLITYSSIYWYNDALNNVSSFFVIIAVGLASDASAHYCHAFLEAPGDSKKARATEALDALGPSVFKGGTSTILGICLTGFCVTYVFQVFFRYLMTILVLALWFGLAVMPVLCALVGPAARHAAPAKVADDAPAKVSSDAIVITGAPASAEGPKL